MTEITFKSAGVSARTINLTGPTALSPVGIPAGVIGTSAKGPAFVPVTVPTTQDFVVVFGKTTDGAVNGPLAASEWLRSQQAATFLRVLGAGDGTERVTSGLNKGKVNGAGFVVGSQLPQESLNGALGNNSLAVSGSATGRTYFLGSFVSQSVGSTYLSEAGLTSAGVPLLRGMVMAASGVVLTLSSSISGSNSRPNPLLPATAGNIQGSMTGSVYLSQGKQEFVMLLNGLSNADVTYPNVITASFDPTAPNYFGTILNKDPLRLEEAGYCLYSHFDVHPSLAVTTGSDVVPVAQGGAYERCAFLLTGASTHNSGSVTAPNFEGFEDRYRAASSPWVISQNFGGSPMNLFKVHNLSDGAGVNYKISIENISPSLSDTYRYGRFDLLVRSIGDTDKNREVLEQWRNVSLDPDSENYIARIIGDQHSYFNFDAVVGEQKLESDGEYPNNSKYIRIEVSQEVADFSMEPTALPFGFRGNQHLMTSGTAPMPAYSDSSAGLTNPWYGLVQPPVPMRKSLAKGAADNITADRLLYWGVQFENVISATEPNASMVPNSSILSYMKYYPTYHTEWQNVAVRDNEDAADTVANGIVSSDRFNNNVFRLDKIKVPTITGNIVDVNKLEEWEYVRTGQISAIGTTRALGVNDLKDPSVRQVCKFSFFTEGGFDGTNAFNKEASQLSNAAITEELANANRGLSDGPTVKAYERALAILSDTSEVDIQILTVPGIRHRYITDQAAAMVEKRFDAIYIMDVEEYDTDNNPVKTSDQNLSVRFTANSFRDRGLNTSFAASYFPNAIIRDNLSRVVREVPPSVVVLGAFAKNDAVAFPWMAPAGFARGALETTQEMAVNLSRANMDELQMVNVNPLVAFPGSGGPVVWGQKTLMSSKSALERVNVRRLLLSLRRDIKKVSNSFLFEPNRASTLARFSQLCQPILKRAQDQQGLDNYLVKIDTTTTSQIDIENNTIRGKIFIVPTRTLEALSLDFVLTNQGNFSID